MSATAVKPKRAKGFPRPMGATLDRNIHYAPPTHRRVLVATDGSRPASAAIKLARVMAVRGDWSPSVVTVLEPLPVAVGEVVLPAPPSNYELMVADSVLASIKAQIKRYGDASWPLRTEFGSPPRQILRAATELRPELIVVGLGRHGRLARILGAETAARVARNASVPVLAVNARTWSARNHAIVATDFGGASVRAAREALALLEPPGRVHLVHVRNAFNTTSFADADWPRAYAAAADEEFARLRETLGTRPGIEITTALCVGNVIDTVLAEAKRMRAQVIALGSHSESVFERVMIGSTPAEILRAATCSVLIAPPAHAQP